MTLPDKVEGCNWMLGFLRDHPSSIHPDDKFIATAFLSLIIEGDPVDQGNMEVLPIELEFVTYQPGSSAPVAVPPFPSDHENQIITLARADLPNTGYIYMDFDLTAVPEPGDYLLQVTAYVKRLHVNGKTTKIELIRATSNPIKVVPSCEGEEIQPPQ
jgi:hypothetical protein